MEVTYKEREIINTVVQRFLNMRESTPRKQLIRKFRSVEVLDKVVRGPFFSHAGQDEYVPLPGAFEYCGNQESLTMARGATEIALRVLQNLDEAYPEKEEEGFKFEEFIDQAAKMFNQKPGDSVLILGLYLAQYFNVFSAWGASSKERPGILTWFRFYESIITIDPSKAWDEYIATLTRSTPQPTANLEIEAVQTLKPHNDPPPNRRIRVFKSGFEEYTFVGQRGCGGSGIVFEVRDSSGQHLALKTLNSNIPRAKISRFKNEIEFCLRPPSDRIVRVLDYGRTDKGSPFYVMPLYSSTLRDRIRDGIPLAEVLPLYNQILDGIEAAHLLGVYHRDIKPENILSDAETGLVLADFGIAHFQEDQLRTTIKTNSNEKLANFVYAAPEQRSLESGVDYRADIYALGLILNEMYTKQVAHGTGFRRIEDVAPEYAYLDGLVDMMIQQQPNQRPESIRRVKEELIGRGNEFVRLQRLGELRRRVVPEPEIDDPILEDPIRVIEKLDYNKGVLMLKLNRPVNLEFDECFKRRVARFNINVSSAIMSLHADIARVIVTERFLQEGVNFLKEGLTAANEEYAAQIKKEHQQRIEDSRAALKSQIDEAEARARVLKKVAI